jgi:hypothetical protein
MIRSGSGAAACSTCSTASPAAPPPMGLNASARIGASAADLDRLFQGIFNARTGCVTASARAAFALGQAAQRRRLCRSRSPHEFLSPEVQHCEMTRRRHPGPMPSRQVKNAECVRRHFYPRCHFEAAWPTGWRPEHYACRRLKANSSPGECERAAAMQCRHRDDSQPAFPLSCRSSNISPRKPIRPPGPARQSSMPRTGVVSTVIMPTTPSADRSANSDRQIVPANGVHHVCK